MWVKVSMTPAVDSSSSSAADRDALVARLLSRVEELVARVAALEAENAALREENVALRARLKLPPKTPDNSSTPPLQGHKPSGGSIARPVNAGVKMHRRAGVSSSTRHAIAGVRPDRELTFHPDHRTEVDRHNGASRYGSGAKQGSGG